MKWAMTRDMGHWDSPWSDRQPGKPPPDSVPAGEARVTYVGHATVLIQMDGVNIALGRGFPFRPFDPLAAGEDAVHSLATTESHYDKESITDQ